MLGIVLHFNRDKNCGRLVLYKPLNFSFYPRKKKGFDLTLYFIWENSS